LFRYTPVDRKQQLIPLFFFCCPGIRRRLKAASNPTSSIVGSRNSRDGRKLEVAGLVIRAGQAQSRVKYFRVNWEALSEFGKSHGYQWDRESVDKNAHIIRTKGSMSAKSHTPQQDRASSDKTSHIHGTNSPHNETSSPDLHISDLSYYHSNT